MYEVFQSYLPSAASTTTGSALQKRATDACRSTNRVVHSPVNLTASQSVQHASLAGFHVLHWH